MERRSRLRALSLILIGMAVFAGTTVQLLPAEAFFPALATGVLGAALFFRAHRAVKHEIESRTKRALDPKLHHGADTQFAQRQADLDGRRLESLIDRHVPSQREEILSLRQRMGDTELSVADLEAVAEEGFEVSSDVSFPIEIQQRSSVADQIYKLQQLKQEGIISDQEFDTAKSKLLS
ncbi:SHOCT domain-containing protein [Myxococcota bacterium]|nr:SHOCT domain-containing protein [Myxococcota bacterium]